MSEVLRMRFARAPQRIANSGVLRWPAQDGPTAGDGHDMKSAAAGRAGKPAASRTARSFLEELAQLSPQKAQEAALTFTKSRRFVGAGDPLQFPLRELDEWLLSLKYRAEPPAIIHEFGRLASTSVAAAVASARWHRERDRIYESLIALVVAQSGVTGAVELVRLLSIVGLVESLALPHPSLTTADDVEEAMRYRILLLPPWLLRLIPRRARLARRYGVADLYVVRDEWSQYQAGEIAHIENVLPFESKRRVLTTLNETEQSTSTSAESVDIEEHDSQTTDRMEIQQHAQNETDLGVHVAAQVEIEASYGPMHIAATVGGSFDFSQKNAQDHAFQQSHEMVSRAVKRVEERVKTERTTRSLQRTTEINKHALNNTTDERVVGIYRWVDKVQRLQLYRYPHRLLLEFEIPDRLRTCRGAGSSPGASS